MLDINNLINKMENADQDNSIVFYTIDDTQCMNIKILIDPFETLSGMAIKPDKNNYYNNNLLRELNKLNNSDDEHNFKTFPQDDTKTKFITDKKTFDKYIYHIEELFKLAYINYYNSQVTLPSKVYRSVTKKELDFLNKSRAINTLYSVSKDLDTSIGFTIEKAEHEWNPQEHFIIAFSIKERVPFIDVDKSIESIFEPNEIILIPPFYVTKPKLTKNGGMNALGFYSFDSIPEYQSTLKMYQTTENVKDFQTIYKLYEEIRNEIEIYGKRMENYLNNEDDFKLLNDSAYRVCAKKLETLIKLLKTYISNTISKDQEPYKLVKKP